MTLRLRNSERTFRQSRNSGIADDSFTPEKKLRAWQFQMHSDKKLDPGEPRERLVGLKQRSLDRLGLRRSARNDLRAGAQWLSVLTGRVARVSAFWPARYLDRNKFTLTYLLVWPRPQL